MPMLDPGCAASRQAAADKPMRRTTATHPWQLTVAADSWRRTTAVLSLALVAALVLGGCSDPPEPAPFDPPVATDTTSRSGSPGESASPSAAPTPAPVLPDAATGATAESAEVFVRFYIDLINHAARTGDTTAMRQYATPECQGCDAIATSIETVEAAGGYFDGDIYFEITELGETQVIDGGAAAVFPTLRTPSGAIVETAGDSPTPQPTEPLSFGLRLEPSDEGWLVTMLARTP